MRHYDVPVLVRTAPEADREAAAVSEPLPPAQFLWHDRLYVVREVLAQWRERTAWWTGAAGRGLHGEAGAGSGPEVVSPRRAGPVEERWDAADRWVWRVEASAGRSEATGTYDLCRVGPAEARDGSAPDGSARDAHGAESAWRLVRVCD